MDDERCPHCDADLSWNEIPEEYRPAYGGAVRWRRVIAIYNLEQDRTVAWRCPDCGHEWPRD